MKALFLFLFLLVSATSFSQTKIFDCKTTGFQGSSIEYWYEANAFSKFEVVKFIKLIHENVPQSVYTIYGIGKKGKRLLSEHLPADMRDEEPLRGFEPIRFLTHNLLSLKLQNDCDTPESHMMLNQASGNMYVGTIRIWWDNEQIYTVECKNVSTI